MVVTVLLQSALHAMKTASPVKEEIPNILLVDDNGHGLVARKAVLEEFGYNVFTARSGEEALELYTARKFDLIVTDYRMPKMDGIELIKKIRTSDSEARIIMLSGFVEPLGLDEKSTGADVVIAKSSGEVGNLVRSVGRLLARRVTKKPPASQKGPRPRNRVTNSWCLAGPGKTTGRTKPCPPGPEFNLTAWI
jgi:CheY-like chemotaxis protein